jgi:molybdopterin molybdotransferase
MTEPSVSNLIGVAEAIRILDATPVTPRVRSVPLADAVGLRLAADVVADRDHPPFEKAVMDGYAVRAADATAGATLVRVDTVAAGRVGQRAVGRGEAVAIMTGAPLPPGADAVVPVELTTRDGERVTFAATARAGQSVARRGSDVAGGVVVLARGTRLGPAQVAVAASVGAAVVPVYERPVVAVLSTGDELVPIDQVPTGAQIRNSNGAMMVALLRQLGCDVRDLGVTRDEPEPLRAALSEGLRADALFVTGGMSMGERDHVPGLLRELGLDLRIARLRVKPGKPFAFATDGRRMAFGLPGNPVSAFVCTVRLAARVLRRMAGGPAEAGMVDARLTAPMEANGPREFYQPATWDGSTVTPLGWRGSADLFTLARANGLIARPEAAPAAAVGDVVRVLSLDPR